MALYFLDLQIYAKNYEISQINNNLDNIKNIKNNKI